MYRKLNNELRRVTERAKAQCMKDKCSEIESLEKKGRYDLMYKETRKYEFEKRRKQTQILTDENNNEIYDEKLVMEKWKKYVEQMYEAKKQPENLETEGTEEVNEENKGCYILRDEFQKGLKEMKNGKAVGVDEIPIELYMNMSDKKRFQVTLFHEECNYGTVF